MILIWFSPVNSWWFVLGGEENTGEENTTSSFQGCAYGVNFLSRGIDFMTDLPDLQSQPSRYRGDLLRWAEFALYGNVRVVRPSTARLVNCIANPTLSECVVQTRGEPKCYSQICPNSHRPLTVICLLRQVCFWLSAKHSQIKLTALLSYTATDFWSMGDSFRQIWLYLRFVDKVCCLCTMQCFLLCGGHSAIMFTEKHW
jgi:hypothetical protein